MDKRLNFYTHLDIVGVAAETPCHEKRERNMLHWVVRKMHSHKQSSSRQAYAWMKNRVVATNTCSHHGVAHRVNFETDRKSYWFSLFFFSFARGSLQWRKRRRRSLHQQQIKNYDNTHVTNKQRRIKKKKKQTNTKDMTEFLFRHPFKWWLYFILLRAPKPMNLSPFHVHSERTFSLLKLQSASETEKMPIRDTGHGIWNKIKFSRNSS